MRCLVTGATGYVGGRLAPRLVAEGHQVRCLVRSAPRLRRVPWATEVDVIEGDVARNMGLDQALGGIEVAYYLVHSLGRAGFERIDRDSATHFAAAAARAGVGRVVYLGGPDPRRGTGSTAPGRASDAPRSASAHLRSRAEVADILLAGEVPAIVLRAAVIIGSGSASFEMLRYLTERLPVMVTPRWVSSRIEPIAIGDVLHYLVGAAAPGAFPAGLNRAFDIGGGEVLSYREMMRRYAAVAGLRPRLIIPVRPLTPALSALWVGLVTPVPNAIARPLVASLIHDAVCAEHDIASYLPDPAGGLTNFDTSIRGALRSTLSGTVPTRWSDAAWPTEAATAQPADPLPTDPDWAGGTVHTDVRERAVNAPVARLWRVIEAIGGERGWYSFPLAWSVRGWLDRLAGGAGLRRGRRHPERLTAGEALDFWRVEEIVAGQLLRLRAEMRLPGRAWLEMQAIDEGAGRSRYRQRATFRPRGLAGQAYWLAVAPFHAIVFGGMARNIARTAERSLERAAHRTAERAAHRTAERAAHRTAERAAHGTRQGGRRRAARRGWLGSPVSQ